MVRWMLESPGLAVWMARLWGWMVVRAWVMRGVVSVPSVKMMRSSWLVMMGARAVMTSSFAWAVVRVVRMLVRVLRYVVALACPGWSGCVVRVVA